MKKFLLPLLALFMLASCGVTESGNPCPGGMCGGTAAGPTAAEANAYTNSSFGVSIAYPEGWTYVVNAAGDSVRFTSGGTPATTALFSFQRIDPAPASLADYLTQQYPTRSFTECNTSSLTGLCFDDPATGSNGGNAIEFFFLNADVLVRVEAELFAASQAEFYELLDGLSFQ